MLKQLSLVIAASLALTACGGAENKKDRTPTPTSSAMASSMISESSAPASSEAASSVASGPTNKVLKISVTNGGSDFWHVQLQQAMSAGIVKDKTYVFSYKVKASEAKSLSVAINTGDDNGYMALPEANNVNVTTEWQTISGEFTATLTDTSVSLNANLGKNGLYDIWFDDFSLTEAGGSNEQFKNGGIVDIADWTLGNNEGGVGALSIDAIAVEVTEPASTDIVADLTQGWEAANGGGTVSYDSDGVMYVAGAPTEYDAGVFFLVPGPVNLEKASVTISMIPDAAFIASGVNPQPFAQVNGGSYAGEYDCWFGNADLVEGVVNELTCIIDSGTAANFNIADETSVRIGFQLNGGASKTGTVSIVGAKIVLAK
jgi:hypothetical protein